MTKTEEALIRGAGFKRKRTDERCYFEKKISHPLINHLTIVVENDRIYVAAFDCDSGLPVTLKDFKYSRKKLVQILDTFEIK